MLLVGPLGVVTLFFGALFAIAANAYPEHARLIETFAGVLLLGGFALIGIDLQMALHATLIN